MHNEYNDGGKCADYSGYNTTTDAWHNGRWCYASTTNCLDARMHETSSATGTVPGAQVAGGSSGYGASRAACGDTGECAHVHQRVHKVICAH